MVQDRGEGWTGSPLQHHVHSCSDLNAHLSRAFPPASFFVLALSFGAKTLLRTIFLKVNMNKEGKVGGRLLGCCVVRIQHFHGCGQGSIPSQGTEIPHQATAHWGRKKKKRQRQSDKEENCPVPPPQKKKNPVFQGWMHAAQGPAGNLHNCRNVCPGAPLSIFFFFFFGLLLPFLGPIPRHMEVPRLGVKSEL